MWAKVTLVDRAGQHTKAEVFYVRVNNGTRAIHDRDQIEKYIAQRWA